MRIKTTGGEEVDVEDQRDFRWKSHTYALSGEFLVAVQSSRDQTGPGSVTLFQLQTTGVYRLVRTITITPDKKIGHCFASLSYAPSHEQTSSAANGNGNGHVKPKERVAT